MAGLARMDHWQGWQGWVTSRGGKDGSVAGLIAEAVKDETER